LLAPVHAAYQSSCVFEEQPAARVQLPNVAHLRRVPAWPRLAEDFDDSLGQAEEPITLGF
jgi:hypothetical protein